MINYNSNGHHTRLSLQDDPSHPNESSDVLSLLPDFPITFFQGKTAERNEASMQDGTGVQ